MKEKNSRNDAMTLAERASLVSGRGFWHTQPIEHLGIASIMLADGPHGLRKPLDTAGSGIGASSPATCFPSAVGLASTWNIDLVEEVGRAIGKEARAQGVSVLLAPGVNIKRHPLCGRNFEYYSEDPFLSGNIAAAFIKGVQSQGVGASLKHFVANNQETKRMVLDAVIDERTLREIYLEGFRIAIEKAEPWTVMAAYNKVNGTYMSEHVPLLDGVLRGQWGYKGLVVSDWGAVNSRVEALRAGLDLEMPSSGGKGADEIVRAIKKGTLSEEVLDVSVSRVLALVEKSAKTKNGQENDVDVAEHHHLARTVAAESMVLLQNEDDLLPLAKHQSIALIGAFAEHPRIQGEGSSRVVPTGIDTPLAAFREVCGDNLRYAAGYDPDTSLTTPELLHEAKAAAEKASAAVVLVGLPDDFESEGFDREHLEMPKSHVELVETILKVNRNVVCVLTNGTPITLPFKDDVPAILEQYLPGQAGGKALADIVFGETSPSGKLAETFPKGLAEFPAHQDFAAGKRALYKEGLYVGYRFYTKAGLEPLFPFGHGLSYTAFALSDLSLDKDVLGANERLRIRVLMKNIGPRAGKETVQLYISKADSAVYRPGAELKAYQKVHLEKGEDSPVTFALSARDFAVYSPAEKRFLVEEGDYIIGLGFSSADIRLRRTVHMKGERLEKTSSPYHAADASFRPTDADFAQLLGHPLPKTPPLRPFHENSTLEELRASFIGKLLVKKVAKRLKAAIGSDAASAKMMETIALEMPYRNLATMSGGAFSKKMSDTLLLLMNRRYFKALKRSLRKS